MDKILELDRENLTVTVQPGVLLMDLAAFAEENSLFYPPDPGEKGATIGGNIATNAGGMRAVKYGVTRDYVWGLTVVLANGKVIGTGGQVAKNSSGYSLRDLFVGSEGTLGIITEACLNHEALDVPIVDTEERKKSVWNARGAFLEAIKASTSEMDECDVVLPRSKIGEFIAYSKQLAGQYGVRIPGFGHAGDGNLHIYICRDEMDPARFAQVLKEIFTRLYQRADELHGLVSGEHGIGWAKRPYLHRHMDAESLRLMREIKIVFDPGHILNPGKII